MGAFLRTSSLLPGHRLYPIEIGLVARRDIQPHDLRNFIGVSGANAGGKSVIVRALRLDQHQYFIIARDSALPDIAALDRHQLQAGGESGLEHGVNDALGVLLAVRRRQHDAEAGHIQPISSRWTTLRSTVMPFSSALRQSIRANFSPPCSRKMSRFSTPISSMVSRQSAAKPGVTMASRFTPRTASSFTVASV